MEFVFGASLLYAAMLLTMVLRLGLKASASASWARHFGLIAASFAFLISVLGALGLSQVIEASLVELGAYSLLSIAIACVGMIGAGIATWTVLPGIVPSNWLEQDRSDELGAVFEFPPQAPTEMDGAWRNRRSRFTHTHHQRAA